MITFIADDHESIIKQLSSTEIPDKVLPEYMRRLTMYHRGGGSGPLGPLALVDMLRHLELGVEPAEKADEPVDWRTVEPGQRIIVDDGFGVMSGATFRGVMGQGILEILIDGDAQIAEAPGRLVQIDNSGNVPNLNLEEDEFSDDNFEFDDDTDEGEVYSIDGDEPEEVDTNPWNSVVIGAPVLVDDSGETIQGRFQGSDNNQLLISIEGAGEARVFSQELVSLENE